MQFVGHNLNSYQMNTKGIEPKRKDEKAAEAQTEEKGAVKAGETQKPIQVEARALEVLAQQNQCFINKPVKPENVSNSSEVRETPPFDELPYKELVKLWDNGNNDYSPDERILLLNNLMRLAPTNEEYCQWAVIQEQVCLAALRSAFEAGIEGLQNGTLDPREVYGNLMNGDFPGAVDPGVGEDACRMALYDDYPFLDGTSINTRIAMLNERINYLELWNEIGNAALEYNPYGHSETILDCIAERQLQILEYRNKIAELKGLIHDEPMIGNTQINTQVD